MSGAGSTSAGFAPAGLEVDAPSFVPRAVTPPHALYLDPAVMDFTTDADGHYQSVHPNDHWAEMQLAVAFGTVSSAPGVGSTIRNLQIGSRAQMTLDATNIAKTALAARIATGDVASVYAVAYASAANRAHVEIFYQNTRLPDADRNRSVTLP